MEEKCESSLCEDEGSNENDSSTTTKSVRQEVHNCDGGFNNSSSSTSCAVSNFKPIPLTKRKTRKSSSTTNNKVNFLFSDSNPLCTQLYLKAIKPGEKYRRDSSENMRELELEKRQRRNSQAQQIRDDKKYEDCLMKVHLIQGLIRNAALRAQLRFLESRKDALMNILATYGLVYQPS